MTNPTNKTARQSHLQWVALGDLNINPVAQREFSQRWMETILNKFDIDKFQVPHVNRRTDGSLYIMDGQHSIQAYREWLGDDDERQKVQVWLYDALTEQEEAEFFLSFNNKKAVGRMDRFKVGVTAGRDIECDIDRIVRACGCSIGNSQSKHAISAVGALDLIYRRLGAKVLGQTIRVIRDSFGDEGGYERPVLLGIAQVLARYPHLDIARLVLKLSGLRNGWKGVVQKTAAVRDAMGVPVPEAAAAAVVEIYNAGRGGNKLPSWFRDAA